MRCLATKAAALLSSTVATALVIPGTRSLSTPPSDAVIEYNPYNALLKFAFDDFYPIEGYPISTLQIDNSSRPCGESNVLLNGQKLDATWDGTNAHGRDYLDIYDGKEAEWHIECLFEVLPKDGSNSNGEDVVQVLSLQFIEPIKERRPGFTVSYKQLNPAILRFTPAYTRINIATSVTLTTQWRTPSLEFDPDVLENFEDRSSIPSFSFRNPRQETLGTYLRTFEDVIKQKVHKVIEHLYLKAESNPHKLDIPSAGALPEISSDASVEPAAVDHDELLTSISEDHTVTATTPNFAAAETRSLHLPDPFYSTPTSISSPTNPSLARQRLALLKTFGLILVVSSCVAWVVLRCRDPRRQVERRARWEECRNRKLYRRAAHKHKMRMWFWGFRLRWKLVPKTVIDSNEKGIRVAAQEAVLEDAVKDDVRVLRDANGGDSSNTIAEESMIGFPYDSEGSERRRSVSTLPGYESEASLPPSYCATAGNAIATDGFRFRHVETEFTPDSSVISTSPRISRDGTNSDFDEKFEPI